VVHSHIFRVEFALLSAADECIDESVLGVCATFESLIFVELRIVLEELAFDCLEQGLVIFLCVRIFLAALACQSRQKTSSFA